MLQPRTATTAIKSPLLNEKCCMLSKEPPEMMKVTPTIEIAVPINWNFVKRSFKKIKDNMYINIGVEEFIKEALIGDV